MDKLVMSDVGLPLATALGCIQKVFVSTPNKLQNFSELVNNIKINKKYSQYTTQALQ